ILTNNNAVSRPSDVLTALLWDMGNNSAVLTNYDADVTAGSTPGGQDLDNVGGNDEWRFRQNPAGLAGVTQHYGVGTAGMGIFGGGGGGQQMQWGLINGKMANANSPINSGTFIQNSATFAFTVPSGFSGTISNVRFQYGTSLTEPSILCANAAACRPPDSDTPTPEPSTFGMMGLAGASLVVAMRRRV
ncbi:MAG: PEP-CTERM sorting domain-containing protein, partial [Bryobacterales bacterium]|nr:PEP-CTERM sorting domain-containing protein [Bryobacterales bacterium]